MDTSPSTTYRLTIRMSQGSLSFSTVRRDAEGARVVYEPFDVNTGISMAANLREALKTAQLPARGYERATVVADERTLLVPHDSYDPASAETLYYHAFPRTEECRVVVATNLPDLGAVAVFSVNRDARTVLADHFSDLRFTCVAAPVWRHLHQRSLTGTHAKLFAHFHDRRLEVFAFAQGRFRFCNSYDGEHTKDAVYYILAAWNQLGLDHKADELHIAGEPSDKETLLAQLRRFLANVYAVNPAGEFNRAPITRIPGMTYDLMTYYLK